MTHLLAFDWSHTYWFVFFSCRLLLYGTHSYMWHFPLIVIPICLLLVSDACAHFLYCQTNDILISYIWSHNYLAYALLNHSNISFSCFCVYANSSYLIYLDDHLHFILFFCVNFIIIIILFKFHFTPNIHCFMECFQILMVF